MNYNSTGRCKASKLVLLNRRILMLRPITLVLLLYCSNLAPLQDIALLVLLIYLGKHPSLWLQILISSFRNVVSWTLGSTLTIRFLFNLRLPRRFLYKMSVRDISRCLILLLRAS